MRYKMKRCVKCGKDIQKAIVIGGKNYGTTCAKSVMGASFKSIKIGKRYNNKFTRRNIKEADNQLAIDFLAVNTDNC
jgi:hypothetical protein